MINTINKIVNKLKFEFPYDTEWWVNNGMPQENYHRHTTWSNVRQKDSATTLNGLIRETKANGGKCLFSGEHGWQGSYLHVYDLACESGLKFRYSTEAYWVKDRFEQDRANCHIVLVARTNKGLEDINYALSMANIDGYYHKPRLDLQLIMELDPKDVYITSACVGGWKYEDAEEIWLSIHRKFRDSFFLEVQNHDTDEQRELNKRIVKLSKQRGIQIISGLDTHFLNDEERIERDNYLKRNGIEYEDEYGWFMNYPDTKETIKRYIKQGVLSNEEILESIMNTCVFINGCENVEFDRSFKIPSIHKGKSHKDKSKLFLDLLESRYKQEEYQSQEKYDGMLYEYNEIINCETEDYFMLNDKIIYDGINKYGGVLTTTSRGSAASFITSKLLGFTTIDRFTSEIPMYPQRFLTSDRILKSKQLPDVDMNMSSQEPFVKATKDIVGEHGCYPLVAFGQLKEKSAWKMYADINGVDPQTANEVSKFIDKYNMDLKHAETDEDKEAIVIDDYIPEQYVEIYEESKKYQGIIDGAKGHACGFLVLDDDIRRKCGVIRCVSESTGKSTLCTVLDGSLLDAFGYVKNDYLIVSVVDIIDRCWKSIGQKVPTIDELRRLTSNDPLTWKTYEMGATMCVNQCERDKTTQRVMRYKPKTLEEVAAFVAAIRPGFKSLLTTFLDRQSYTSGEDKVDELLESSYNFMLYQESLMKIFAWLGIDMGECYDIIKSISKKKLKGKKLADFERKLRENWIKNVGNDDNFEDVYQVVKDSANYAFNSPHALAVGADSLYIAYFKQHYTSNFYEVVLNYYMDKDDKDKVSAIIKEARTLFGYKLGSYEYGKDNSKFTVDDETKIIYPNLASIKGIGKEAVLGLVKLYSDGNNNIAKAYLGIRGTKVNKTVFSNLIKIGYFKQFGSTKMLLDVVKIIDTFYDAKVLTIEKLKAEGYNVDEIAKYGRSTGKQIRDLDKAGLMKYLMSGADKTEDSTIEIMRNQNEILGLIDIVDPSFDKKTMFVMDIELNSWGTPFAKIYRMCDGATSMIKIDKKAYNENPTKKNDVVFVSEIKHQFKKRKVDGKFVNLDEKEFIMTKYSIVK